jgi:hypothetical protein
MTAKNPGKPGKRTAPAIKDRSDTAATATAAAPIGAGTAALPTGLPPRGRRGEPDWRREPAWRVYCIVHREDDMSYVGLTRRPLAVRLAAHDHMARRRPDLGGPGTLAAAIRQAYNAGGSFAADFKATVLAEASSAVEARHLERTWIERLGTASPGGYNIMPGGSLGGPANAIPVVLDHPRRGRLTCTSVMEAVAEISRERRAQGQPPLRLGTIYARRAMDWSLEEALELKAHTDGRRRRARFWWHGRSYETLEELARAEGLRIDTIRSRLHRARRAGCGPDHDVARDRRLPGARRTGGVGCGRQPPLRLPHPTDPAAGTVTAADYARMTGLPRATVLHRYHRLMAGRDPGSLSRSEVLAALMQAEDRRLTIALTVPGGQTLSGGVRAVIRDVLDTPSLRVARAEPLSASAIRARLRKIPGWPGTLPPEAVAWAFGFQPDARPAP